MQSRDVHAVHQAGILVSHFVDPAERVHITRAIAAAGITRALTGLLQAHTGALQFASVAVGHPVSATNGAIGHGLATAAAVVCIIHPAVQLWAGTVLGQSHLRTVHLAQVGVGDAIFTADGFEGFGLTVACWFVIRSGIRRIPAR